MNTATTVTQDFASDKEMGDAQQQELVAIYKKAPDVLGSETISCAMARELIHQAYNLGAKHHAQVVRRYRERR